jgi:TonB family protein
VNPKQWEGYVVDGRFHLRQYLGGSAQSDVFLTEYGQGSPQKAAIKLVPADWAKAHAWTLRCESARKLSHPGLLSIFEVGTCRIDDADWAYAVMELADEDLSQVIPLRPLVAGEAREMLTAAVGPLAYLHERGFVHGHLTPANIMAARDRIKISSDGLLRIGKSSGDRWTPNANDAPEIRTGVTPASDVWSLGMTLAEVLTQHAPAWDRSAANDPAVPGTLGAPFREIVHGCLRADPRLRISLADILQALRPASPAPRFTVPAKPAASGRKYLAAAILVAIIITGAIVTGAILTRTRLTNSPSGTESHHPVPTEKTAAPEKPGTAIAESASGQTAGNVINRFVPEVPREILGTIRGGVTVLVRARVDSSGAVVGAELDSPPGSRYFDRLALEATRRWKFAPASGDAGHATESTRLVRFEFLRDGCTASADAVRR